MITMTRAHEFVMGYRRMSPGRTFRDKCPNQVEIYMNVVVRVSALLQWVHKRNAQLKS